MGTSSINNSIQNISNDFQTIFPELLDLVKQLTSKWDPSISDESDPGVVLLKLNALLADKLNYNIDQNILECFPSTVQQEKNARKLFEQLGYNMHLIQSAEVVVNMKWLGDIQSDAVLIPKFTMITDVDNAYIYTLLGPYQEAVTSNNIGDYQLLLDNSNASFKAIEGQAFNYKIDDSYTITVNNLDSDNRLYFQFTDIAENGIFISNIDTQNYNEWERVDNLLIQESSLKCYKMGIAQDTGLCYVEFPENAINLFGSGIQITYVRSNGADGTVANKVLEKFYSDLDVSLILSGDTVTLTEDNVYISNISTISSGKDAESIDDAYKNYKRTIGTFDTLITARDILNKILLNNLASNGLVTDKNNDIQCAYQIINENGSYDTNIEQILSSNPVAVYSTPNIETVTTTGYIKEDALSVFDLKFYLLNYVDNVLSEDDFNRTFELQTKENLQVIQAFLEEFKYILHNYAHTSVDLDTGDTEYEPYLKITGSNAHICFFYNKFPLKVSIYPKQSLTSNQIAEIRNDILSALYKKLNAKELTLGEKISIDTINTIILEADSRIKSVSIYDITYETYAVIWDGSTFQTINISKEPSTVLDRFNVSTIYDYATYMYGTDTTPQLAKSNYNIGDYCVYENNGAKHRFKCISEVNINASFDSTHWELADVEITLVDTTYDKIWDKFGVNNYYPLKIKYIDSTWKIIDDHLIDAQVSFNISDVDISMTNQEATALNYISLRRSYAEQIKDDIYSKSILNGNLKILENSSDIDQSLNYIEPTDFKVQKINNVYEVSSDLTIELSSSNPEYTLRENEGISLYSPNYITQYKYSNCKFEAKLNSVLAAETNYALKAGEYIVLYYKTTNDNSELYSYNMYGEGTVIQSSFNLSSSASITTTTNTLYQILQQQTSTPKSLNDAAQPLTSEQSEVIRLKLASSSNQLGTTKNIQIQTKNVIELNNSTLCYWITNNADTDKYYLEFELDESDIETLIYSSSNLIDKFTINKTIINEIGEYNFTYNSNIWTCITPSGSSTATSLESYGININSGITIEDNNYIKVVNQGTYKYLLKNDEYLFYTNQYLQEVNVLGSGTLLKQSGYATNRKLQVKINSVTKLLSGDFSAIDNSTWKYIDEYDGPIEAVEQQLLSLNNKQTIKLEQKQTSNDTWKIIINSSGYSGIDISNYNFLYKEASDSDFQTLNNLMLSNDSLGIYTNLYININSSTDQILLNNQNIEVKYFKIVDNIVTNESIIIKGADLNTSSTNNYYPTCIKSSLNIEVSNNLDYLNLLNYSKCSLINQGKLVNYNEEKFNRSYDNNSLAIHIKSRDIQYIDIPFYLENGEYLIKLDNSGYQSLLDYDSKDLTTCLYLESNNQIVFPIYIKQNGYLNKVESTILDFYVEGQNNIRLHIPKFSSDLDYDFSPYTITLSNCTQVKLNDSIKIKDAKKYLQLIQILDLNSNYNYLANISSTKKIDKPLEAINFFNTNHVYNKCTISQLDTSSLTSDQIVIYSDR